MLEELIMSVIWKDLYKIDISYIDTYESITINTKRD